MSLRSDMSESSVSSSSQMNVSSIEKFPSNGRETADFRDWLFKAEAVLLSRNMLVVVKSPIAGLPVKQGEADVVPADCNTDAKRTKRAQLKALSATAYSLIVNSLSQKQIELVRDVYQGNAHEVMNVLKRSYGVHLSTASAMATFAALLTIKKQSKESMNDYFARVGRLVHDCDSLDMSISPIQHKFFIVQGLSSDKEWKQTTTVMSQMNASKAWSVTEMQQYLIEQENAKNVLNEKASMQEESALEVHTRGGYRGRGRGNVFRGGRGRLPFDSDNVYRASAVNEMFRGRGSHSYRGNYRGNFRGSNRGNYRGRYQQQNNHNNHHNVTRVCNVCNKSGHVASECRSVECYNCNKIGHMARDCRVRKYSNNSTQHSYNTSTSHDSTSTSSSPPSPVPTTSTSHKRVRHGVVDNNDGLNVTRAYVTFAYTSSSVPSYALSSRSTLKNAVWILDGAATEHFTGNKGLLTNITLLPEARTVRSANKVSVCHYTGTAHIYTNTNKRIALHNVLYVEGFSVNLISVAKITDIGDTVTFERGGAIVRGGAFEWRVPRVDNLYLLSSSKTVFSSSSSSSSSESSESWESSESTESYVVKDYTDENNINTTSTSSNTNNNNDKNINPIPTQTSSTNSNNSENNIKTIMRVLHRQCGHVNYRKLCKMIKNKSVNHYISVSLNNINERILRELTKEKCVGCLRGKMTRASMTGVVDWRADEVLDVLVVDICGAINVPTFSGVRYILLLMDVKSRKIFCFLLKYKSEAADKIINLVKCIQNQKGKIVKRYHGDNAPDLMSNKVVNFFEAQGTIVTTSTANTSQLNALIERMNRTELEMMRCVMYSVDAYMGLWAEAAMYCAYIIDRLINVHNEYRSPIELYDERKPDMKYIHVWGCDVHYHVTKKVRQNKLSAVSRPAIFVGNMPNEEHKYRVFDVEKMKVIITHEVHFFESDFSEMKRLVDEMRSTDDADRDSDNDENNNNNSVSENDALPDSVFRDSVTLLKLFSSEGVVEHEVRDSKNEIDNNDNIIDDDDNNNNDYDDDHDQESDNNNNNDIEESNDDNNMNIEIPDDNDDNESDNNVHQTNVKRNRNNNVGVKSNNIHKKVSKHHHQPTRQSSRTKASPYRYSPDDFAAAMSTSDEPMTYTQAMNSVDKHKWVAAINSELKSHDENQTWTIVELEHINIYNVNIVDCRWVFKVKVNLHGVGTYKARLVARGYKQVEGVDYNETFAPVLKYKSLRIILALSADENVKLKQLDVKTAFLNAKICEDIYVHVPEGLNIDKDKYVLKLNRALYGLKQAPREWNKEISGFLISIGYVSCKKDPCVYVKVSNNNKMIIVGLFVDDMVVSFNVIDENEWMNDLMKLKVKYVISDLGDIHHILGMCVVKNGSVITIDQERYVSDKLKIFNFYDANIMDIPSMDMKLLDINSDSELLSESETNRYRMMTGSLIYASISTRPDITHATHTVSRFMSQPTQFSMTLIQRVFRYLNGTRCMGLKYINNNINNNNNNNHVCVGGYCDADWGGEKIDRKSLTGYCTFINDNLISWATKKQQTVALSSAEAEYMGISEVAKEVMWLRILLKEMNMNVETPSIIYVDNQASIRISENDADHDRTKHIDIRHYFIRDLINNNEIKLQWISTHDQLADIFTKSLGKNIFKTLREKLMSDIKNKY